MHASRQIVRWVIPGSLFLLFCALLQIAWTGMHNLFLARGWCVGGPTLLPSVGKESPASAIVGVAAGLVLTIGYAVYQLYFWGYWRMQQGDRGLEVLCIAGKLESPPEGGFPSDANLKRVSGLEFDVSSFKRAAVNHDVSLRSRVVKGGLRWARYKLSRIAPESPIGGWKEKEEVAWNLEEAALTRREENWYRANLLWHIAARDLKEAGVTLKQQVDYCFEIFHSLGASRSALGAAWLSWFGAGLVLLFRESPSIHEFGPHGGFSLVATGVLSFIIGTLAGASLKQSRRVTLNHALNLMALGLAQSERETKKDERQLAPPFCDALVGWGMVDHWR